jgi:rubrerythrin
VELGTFGAIFNFALELEQQSVAFYTDAARGTLEEVFNDLARGARKRIERLERTRREGVAEMILESITGLDGDNYHLELAPAADEASLLAQATSLEGAARRFYLDAGEKMPVREVARIFDRLAREHEGHTATLAEIKPPA